MATAKENEGRWNLRGKHVRTTTTINFTCKTNLRSNLFDGLILTTKNLSEFFTSIKNDRVPKMNF